jgi:hypothetical protein
MEADMAKLTTSILAIAALALAACSHFPRDDSHAYRSGTGVVESVRAVNEASPPARTTGTIDGSPAATGSTTASPSSVEAYQLTIRMDDGKVQTLTQNNSDFRVGDRVQVTSDGRVVRYAG